jgi:nucleoredoxin
MRVMSVYFIVVGLPVQKGKQQREKRFQMADKMLGVQELQKNDGTLVPVSSLAGKTLLMYFSAHWCPPCRMFTPQLVKFYNDLKNKRDDFELVFMSSDREESQFDEYFAEMPFLAMPYANRKEKMLMSKKFAVQGIPMLVVVDANGDLITKNGREEIIEDPEGAKFPWAPRTVFEIIGDAPTILTKSGNKLGAQDLKKVDAFALYFSAHWCGPCRAFTPQLVDVYNKIKASGANIEFVFVSSDREEAAFNEYYEEMPWAALPFGDWSELKKKYEIEGIPTVVTVGRDGRVINGNARNAVNSDPEGKEFPWAPKPLPIGGPLQPTDQVVEALNSNVCVVLDISHGEDKDAATKEFIAGATAFDTAYNASRNVKVSFFVTEGGDLFGRVVQLLKLPETTTSRVVAFFLENEKANNIREGAITKDELVAFTKAFADSQPQ